MRKVIMILAALILVVSGVAAVSAYEAHIVNVKAQVEMALKIDEIGGTAPDYEVNWGTAFPEEWLTECIQISTSTSFCAQTRVTEINYSVYAEAKPASELVAWGGDFMYVKIYETDPAGNPGNNADGSWTRIDPAATPPADGYPTGLTPQPGDTPIFITAGTLSKTSTPQDTADWVAVAMDVPAFQGYYNADTDVDPKPSGMSIPTVVIANTSPRFVGPGGSMDFGINLKIQVTDIYAP